MDYIITLVRFPIGIIALLGVVLFWVSCFLFETVIVIVCLPIAAIILDRKQIKDSFFGKYPQSNPMENIARSWEKIRNWVLTDWQSA